MRQSVPLKYVWGRIALASSSTFRHRTYEPAPPPDPTEGGATMDGCAAPWPGDTDRLCTSGSGVRVLACVVVGGGGRRKNSGRARFSMASTPCRLNQLVRSGMDSVSSGGRAVAVGEAGLLVGVLDVVDVLVVLGGCGRKGG